jgi:hypothetical protein
LSVAFADNVVMTRNTRELETRLERIEKELADLKAVVVAKQRIPWYREITGSFAGDEAFAEIIRLGRLMRQGKLKG